MEKFWVVVVDTESTQFWPKEKYSTFEEAAAEAERRCRKVCRKYYILEVISSCAINNLPVKWEGRKAMNSFSFPNLRNYGHLD